MRRPILLVLFLAACVSSGPPNRPNEKEWNALLAEHRWIQTLRESAPRAPAGATRKQEIEIRLEALKKLEPVYKPFMDKLGEYYQRTFDRRAAQLLAAEEIVIGDQYMYVLARYDRAIGAYQNAIALDADNASARARLAEAQRLRFVDMDSFAGVKVGMREEEVRRALGIPREDWIKQVVQKNRVYTVWIYPRQDGAAAAIYFDNGVVYHTNWNAAPSKSQ
jgi:hypothetical protein